MRFYAALATAALLAHLAWCAWVALGWMTTRGHRILSWLHIISLGYAIVIELLPWPPCPLTVAEGWLEGRAGFVPERWPFLVRVLDAVIYPNLPQWAVVGGAVIVCAGILSVYARRALRHEF